jgi:hypothetical protein
LSFIACIASSVDFQSPPPTNVSVIKSRVFYETVKSGDVVKPIKSLNFASNAALAMPAGPIDADYLKTGAVANNDRAFIQKMLKEDNLRFVAHFAANKKARDDFSSPGQDKDLVPPGSEVVEQAKVEQMVDSAAGGTLAAATDPADPSKTLQDWIDVYTKTLPNYAGRTTYGENLGQAKLELVEDTSLGKADNTAKNLGRVFQIPPADMARLNELMEAFHAGKIQNGQDLLEMQKADASTKPVGHIALIR